MIKYYTRACNFFYGKQAKFLIKKKIALPLCGNQYLAFSHLEVFKRHQKKITSNIFHINQIKNLGQRLKQRINKDLKKITSKRKNFIKNVNFSSPSIMGILNLTPDSFSDGGKFNKRNKSFNHISNLINSGANIIDVGGESTRPGSKTVKDKVEWDRIKFVIKKFKKKYRNIALSIDTRKSTIIEKSIKNGVDLINDVSGFKHDKKSICIINNFKIPKVLHHMQGTPKTMQKNPHYKNVLLDIYDFFENNIKSFKDNLIILDPGIGFGKTLKHNLTLISKISLFHSLGFPILVGTSRKKFIGQISGINDSNDRTGGTLASVLFLMSQGVQLFRVHNVNEIKQGILVFKSIINN